MILINGLLFLTLAAGEIHATGKREALPKLSLDARTTEARSAKSQLPDAPIREVRVLRAAPDSELQVDSIAIVLESGEVLPMHRTPPPPLARATAYSWIPDLLTGTYKVESPKAPTSCARRSSAGRNLRIGS